MDSPSQTPATRFDERPNFDVLFPPLPRTLVEVSRIVASPLGDTSLPALVRAIEFDPVTTTAVLRRVNSAYFGLRQQVSDLEHAVRLLGFRDVCELVITSAVSRIELALATPEQEQVFHCIMRLSIGTAFYGRLIGQRLELEGQSLTYTVALLCNLGRLVLFYNRLSDYEALWLAKDAAQPPSASDERLIFGLDHRALLDQAALVWQLPPDITDVLRHLHHPGHMSSPVLRQVALAVAIAQHAALELAYPADPGPELSTSAAMHALARSRGFGMDALRTLLEDHAPQSRRFVDEMLRD